MKTRIVYAIATAFCISVSFGAAAQEAEEGQIVIDDLSRAELRSEIEKIEDEIYRVFNLTIENELLHVTCETYSPTGTYIRVRRCEPYFLTQARSRNLADWDAGVDGLANDEELRANLTEEFELFTVAMDDVLQDSDYFRELNYILGVLSDRLEELSG